MGVKEKYKCGVPLRLVDIIPPEGSRLTVGTQELVERVDVTHIIHST